MLENLSYKILQNTNHLFIDIVWMRSNHLEIRCKTIVLNVSGWELCYSFDTRGIKVGSFRICHAAAAECDVWIEILGVKDQNFYKKIIFFLYVLFSSNDGLREI